RAGSCRVGRVFETHLALAQPGGSRRLDPSYDRCGRRGRWLPQTPGPGELGPLLQVAILPVQAVQFTCPRGVRLTPGDLAASRRVFRTFSDGSLGRGPSASIVVDGED